jgi:Acyltransferase
MTSTVNARDNTSVLMSQWFAPTRLIVTFEKSGQGRFSQEDIERIVVRDKTGSVVGLDLPEKSVLIANHQVRVLLSNLEYSTSCANLLQIYADWWYAWCLTYFMGTHKDVFIVLKESLKWVPVIGWVCLHSCKTPISRLTAVQGMQFFDFIFLARSWASDRVQLASQLAFLGRQAEQGNKPLSLILYPEGTLISENTKPISKKFADKMGIVCLHLPFFQSLIES